MFLILGSVSTDQFQQVFDLTKEITDFLGGTVQESQSIDNMDRGTEKGAQLGSSTRSLQTLGHITMW